MARRRPSGLAAVLLFFIHSSAFALKVANNDEGDIDLAEGFDFKEAEEQMTAAMASVLGEWSDSESRTPEAQRAILKRIMQDLQHKLDTPSGGAVVVEDATPASAPNAQAAERKSEARGARVLLTSDASEQEVAVQLNLTDVDTQNTSKDAQAELLGWNLSVANYFTPPTISQIHGAGLLAQWNRARPDKAVLPGDRIVRVNDITWHNNTWVFVERIVEQLRASHGGADGAPGQLRLKIRRQLPKAAGTLHLNSGLAGEADSNTEIESSEHSGEVAVDSEASAGPEKMRFAVDLPLPHVRGLAKTWNMLHPDDPIRADEKIMEATLHLDLARQAPKSDTGGEQ